MPDAGRRELLLHSVAVALLSVYPLSHVLRENLGIVPLPLASLLALLIGSLAVGGALFVALRVVIADAQARAAWLSLFLLQVGLYVPVIQQAAALGWPLRPDRPLVSALYGCLIALIATLVVRPWRLRRRDPVPLIIVGLVLFGTNALIGVARVVPVPSLLSGNGGGWHRAASELIAESATRKVRTATAAPDIYYLILDGFGSTDTLKRLYDLDLSAFTNSLTARGFHVVSGANSNYVQTFLSLASTLNLTYLDTIAGAMGPASPNRFPLAHLIDRNALMALARRAGYRLVTIGSDYGATERMSSVDECVCGQFGSSSTEQAVFAAAPMLVHVLGSRFVHGHRRKVLDAFTELERERSSDRPVFVFAHVIAPHPPFVFEADGSEPPEISSVWLQDGSAFAGTSAEYRRGYSDQTRFITQRLTTVLDRLLTRAGPPPVIVIHGDHGPGLGLNWQSAADSDIAERTAIFAAYHLPGAEGLPYAGMTPLNGARLLSNEYFGTDFPLLEDRSYFSTWGKPYEFLPVSASSTPHGAAPNR
jgi:hypothetical protein